ncbi:hypothetical protein LQ759_12970 [Serratia marcescens]|nr:hypothetical protein [Serratia marcescens]MCF1610804.1 hypothetical protein [Serratia marcescens]MDS0829146.1 hypothetical protein [Serratia marcescens]WPC49477.1 hypothetical protein Q9K10_13990 [Serratia marcescens]
MTFQHHILWITTVTDKTTWRELCQASQQRQDLGADQARENGEQVIAGDWLSQPGITEAEHLEISAAPGVIRSRRREVGGFRD